MKNIKLKLFMIFIISLLFINNSYANKFYEIGNDNISTNKEQLINNELEQINTKYGINLDIILLGKDNKGCYKENNYIRCLRNKYGITGNFMWVINNGIKEETGHGDVNSYMNSDIQYIRGLFSEIDLRKAQEQSLGYLKDGNYYKAIKDSFINSINSKLNNICDKFKKDGEKYNIKVNNCKINELVNIQSEIERKKEIQKEKEKAESIQYQKEVLKTILLIVVLGIIIIAALIYGIKIGRNILRKMKLKRKFKDIEDYSKYILVNEDLLDDDKKILIEKIKDLLGNAEIIITNNVISDKDLKELNDEFENIKELEDRFLKTKDRIKDIEQIDKFINDINI